jgi:hypothetical protein
MITLFGSGFAGFGWAKPTGPAFGGPDDRLRVPTQEHTRPKRLGTALRAFAHPTQRSRTTQFVPARPLAE